MTEPRLPDIVRAANIINDLRLGDRRTYAVRGCEFMRFDGWLTVNYEPTATREAVCLLACLLFEERMGEELPN